MKEVNLGERLSAAKNAKRAMEAKFLQRPSLDDPAVAERRAARAAMSAAREARLADREATRVAQERQIAADRTRQAAEADRAAADKAASDADRELKLKAARDARYAARKARK